MANIGINDFVSKFSGGARPTMYLVTLNFPAGVSTGSDTIKNSYLCKAASIPSSTMGEIQVPFMGRKIKVAGDKEFDDWSVTMINDTDFSSRGAFEAWVNLINEHVSNKGKESTADYYQDLIVEQLDRQGEVIQTYNIRNAWPKSVAEITLSYEDTDSVEEFEVTFALNYWTSDNTDSDSGSTAP